MTATLVTLHVAANTEGLATSGVRALERLLASVGVAVDAQRAWAGKCFVAGLAYIAVLRLREGRGGRWRDIVVVLPWTGS